MGSRVLSGNSRVLCKWLTGGRSCHRLHRERRQVSVQQPYCTANSSSGSWPNTRPVTNSKELLNGTILDGSDPPTAIQLTSLLEAKAKIIFDELCDHTINPQAVFTNTELSLKYIDVYGFDFDYTLVHYKESVHRLIYELARDRLVKQLNYPTAIRGISFDPTFAIRGLHCDINTGYLMKVDAYNHIQLGSVYKGHSPVSDEHVLDQYGGTHVPMHVMDNMASSSHWKMTQFLDLFSIPDTTLFADIVQYFTDQCINFDPEYLFEDVQTIVYNVHSSEEVHQIIANNLEEHLETHPLLPEFLGRLHQSGKKLFMVTNSPFWFVNRGMNYVMQSSDWRDLFDVVVVGARKPSFYSDSARPFRSLNSDFTSPSWQRVSKFDKGEVYLQGNVNDFINMTGWKGSHVMYFGDHVFSDLAEPILQHGWKTGAIIPDLKKEIDCSHSIKFKKVLAKLLTLECLLQRRQSYSDFDVNILLEKWKEERAKARQFLKEVHNNRFGSVFRTDKHPTYFSRRLATFSNLYMSSLDNLMNYSLGYTFIPRRASLPHEVDLNFDF